MQKNQVPCEECIVASMCQEVCNNLEYYVNGLFEKYDCISDLVIAILCSEIRRTAPSTLFERSNGDLKISRIDHRISNLEIIIEDGKITLIKQGKNIGGSSSAMYARCLLILRKDNQIWY